MKINMYNLTFAALFFILFGGLFSCSDNNHGQGAENDSIIKDETSLRIFAAASLTDVLTEIVDSFEMKNNIKIITNMASSGTLARQIEQGEIPDIFLSASKNWANYVDSLGNVIPSFKKVIVQNDLVLIAPKDSPIDSVTIGKNLDFQELLGKDRLSVGDPQHVPAGKYAKQSLEFYEWYDKLKGKTLPAKDVRSALMVVELGESPLGIVYYTDAIKSEKVKIIGTFPAESHKNIEYVATICKDNLTAKSFYEYLDSPSCTVIWKKYGFKK